VVDTAPEYRPIPLLVGDETVPGAPLMSVREAAARRVPGVADDVTFEPDGHLAASGGGGGWLWNMDADASINRICAIAGLGTDP
jgi:hypothetical protein